jgi:hypothetical protein
MAAGKTNVWLIAASGIAALLVEIGFAIFIRLGVEFFLVGVFY